MNELSEKILSTHGKRWLSFYKRNKREYVSTMGWVCEDRDESLSMTRGPCHYDLAYLYRLSLNGLVAVFSGIHESNQPEHVERIYLEWLLFKSPFREAFIPMSIESALKYRVLIGDISVPSNVMGAGLMATRIFNEHPNILNTWWELVNREVNPTVAFAFSHRFMIGKDSVYRNVPSHTGCFTGRFELFPNGGESYLLNFLQDRKSYLEPCYKDVKEGALNTFCLWSGLNKDAANLPKIHLLDQIIEEKIVGSVAHNPFKVVDKDSKQCLMGHKIQKIITVLKQYEEWVK